MSDKEKLAKFEKILKTIIQRQEDISKELKTLRDAGKVKSVKFRELLGEKLVNSRIISKFETEGLL